MSKRVWFLADTHLGCRSNSVLWLNIIEDYFFNFFIPQVKEKYKKGDILVHLGDVFDNRQSLNLAAQNLGIRVFEELSKIFPEIHIIVGNHDIMRKNSNDISSVDCLKYIPNVNVYKEPKILEYGDVKCALMPWRRNTEHERETIKKMGDGIDYLFCHTETQGVQTNPSRKYLSDHGNSRSVFSSFGHVFSGHIHFRQRIGNLTFVGNPYAMTRSDRDNKKGIYILDLKSGDVEFINNTYSPRFKRYYINDIFERRMFEIRDEITNNFVDIFIPSNIVGNYNINKFMDYLDGFANRLEPRIFDEDSYVYSDDESLSEFDGQIDLLKISKKYIESLDYEDELKDKLLKSVHSLYKETMTPSFEES